MIRNHSTFGGCCLTRQRTVSIAVGHTVSIVATSELGFPQCRISRHRLAVGFCSDAGLIQPVLRAVRNVSKWDWIYGTAWPIGFLSCPSEVTIRSPIGVKADLPFHAFKSSVRRRPQTKPRVGLPRVGLQSGPLESLIVVVSAMAIYGQYIFTWYHRFIDHALGDALKYLFLG